MPVNTSLPLCSVRSVKSSRQQTTTSWIVGDIQWTYSGTKLVFWSGDRKLKASDVVYRPTSGKVSRFYFTNRSDVSAHNGQSKTIDNTAILRVNDLEKMIRLDSSESVRPWYFLILCRGNYLIWNQRMTMLPSGQMV